MNNPYAFPHVTRSVPGLDPNQFQEQVTSGGMTLRDYFAAKAMESLLILANDVNTDAPSAIAAAGGVAPYAYKIADAMLKAREA